MVLLTVLLLVLSLVTSAKAQSMVWACAFNPNTACDFNSGQQMACHLVETSACAYLDETEGKVTIMRMMLKKIEGT